jgi:hypothetical protein
MSALRAWIVLAAFVALALMLAALVTSGRLPRIEAEQAAALRLLRDPGPALGESDAFAALWTARHAIADDRIEAVAAASAALWWAHAQGGPRPPHGMPGEHPSILPPAGLRDLPCPVANGDCLPAVRADTARVRSHLEAWEPFRRQNLRLARHDHVRDAFPPLPWAPTPPLMDLLRPELNHAALLHVEGNPGAALEAVCDFAATWRRLGTRSDNLLIHRIALRYLVVALRLHAELASESGADVPEPASCRDALAPLADREFDLCPIMRREFLAAQALLDAAQRGDDEPRTPGGAVQRLLLNREHLLALSSVPLAWYCGEAHLAFVRTRTPLPAELPPRPRCGRLASWLNPLGCQLVPLSRIRHRDHYHRLLDIDAMLRLGLLARILAQTEDPETEFSSLSGQGQFPHHRVTLDRSRGELRLQPLTAGLETSLRFRAFSVSD